jgi:hypothetical protein
MRARLIRFGLPFIFALSSCARPGAELSRWEHPDTSIPIRIIEREEIGNFLNGAYYVFESRSPSDQRWHHVMTFRQDDPIEIPKESVTIKNGVAYIAIGWMFAVTIDSGQTWSVWNAAADLPGWSCCNYGVIRNVDLDSNGTGTMTLNPIPGRAGEAPKLSTRDYGRSWTPSAANR